MRLDLNPQRVPYFCSFQNARQIQKRAVVPGALLKGLVDPVLECVGLDADPDLLLALDVHGLGGVPLGAAGLESGPIRVGHPPTGLDGHGSSRLGGFTPKLAL